MNLFLAALVGGFAGSFHCIGMCGGFACGLSQMNAGSRLKVLLKNMQYNTGRLISYVFIGTLAGALGANFVNEEGVNGTANELVVTSDGMHAMGMVMAGEMGLGQRLLSVVAGVLMLAMALQLLGLRRHQPASIGRYASVGFARAIQSLVRSDRPAASLTLGVINGFLPCPLVFAFAAIAAATASVSHGFMTMLGFGLGTFPAMFFMSGVGLTLSPLVRHRGVRIVGAVVFLMGLLTILRGLLPSMLHGASHSMHTL